MKHPLKRILVTLFLGALLLASASCHSDSDPGLDSVLFKLDTLGNGLLDLQSQTGEVAVWQIATALLVVAAGFALIVGAALGSRARRAAAAFRREGKRPGDSEESL